MTRQLVDLALTLSEWNFLSRVASRNSKSVEQLVREIVQAWVEARSGEYIHGFTDREYRIYKAIEFQCLQKLERLADSLSFPEYPDY